MDRNKIAQKITDEHLNDIVKKIIKEFDGDEKGAWECVKQKTLTSKVANASAAAAVAAIIQQQKNKNMSDPIFDEVPSFNKLEPKEDKEKRQEMFKKNQEARKNMGFFDKIKSALKDSFLMPLVIFQMIMETM